MTTSLLFAPAMQPPASNKTECWHSRPVVSTSNKALPSTSFQFLSLLEASLYSIFRGFAKDANILPSVYINFSIVFCSIGIGKTYLLSFVPENPRVCPEPSAKSQGFAAMFCEYFSYHEVG